MISSFLDKTLDNSLWEQLWEESQDQLIDQVWWRLSHALFFHLKAQLQRPLFSELGDEFNDL